MNATNQSPTAVGTVDPQWHLALNNKAEGPMTMQQVREHVQAGRAGEATMAWTAGMPGWEPAGKLDGLKALFEPPALQPPPLQPPPLNVSAPSATTAAQAGGQAGESRMKADVSEAMSSPQGPSILKGQMQGSPTEVLSAGEHIKRITQPIQGDQSPLIDGTSVRMAGLERMANFAVDLTSRVRSMLTVSPRHRIDVDMRPI